MFYLLFFYFLNNSLENKIIERSLKFAPKEMEMILNDNYKDFLKGIEEGRKMDVELKDLEKKIKTLSNHFKERKKVKEFVFEIGKISVQILRNINKLEENEKIIDHIKKDFPIFIENKFRKFPIVFYGFDKDFFKGHIKKFFEEEIKKINDLTPFLLKGYISNDKIFDRFSLDERSNPFGIAQIFVNKSFSIILNVWYYIWIKNGGRWEPLKPYHINDKIWVLGYGDKN